MRINILMKVFLFLIANVLCAMEKGIGGCIMAGKLDPEACRERSKTFFVVGQVPDRADQRNRFCGGCCDLLKDLSGTVWKDALLFRSADFEIYMRKNILREVNDFLQGSDIISICTLYFQDMVWIPVEQSRRAVFVSLSTAVLQKTADGPLFLVVVLHEQHLDGPLSLSEGFLATLAELAITTQQSPATIREILEVVGDPAPHARTPEEQRAP